MSVKIAGRKSLLVALIAAALLPAAAMASSKADQILSQSGKTVVARNGKIVVTAFGSSATDSSIIKEAVQRFAATAPSAGIRTLLVHNSDSSVVATAERWSDGDETVESGPTGPAPGTPPPPASGTVPPSVGNVNYTTHLNGYTRDTTYTRDVTPDPNADGGFDDGAWYVTKDDLEFTGGGGNGPCKPDAPANCPAPDSVSPSN